MVLFLLLIVYLKVKEILLNNLTFILNHKKYFIILNINTKKKKKSLQDQVHIRLSYAIQKAKAQASVINMFP
jgi:hypothetical protein